RKIDPDGIITTIAGINYDFKATESGDGGPASQARLTAPIEIVMGPDGSLYFSERAGGVNGWKARVRKIDPSGIVTTVVGGGDKLMTDPALTGVGLPATSVNIGRVYGLAFGPDGALYLAFPVEKVVLRLGIDGRLTRFAGNGQNDDGVPSGPASQMGIGQPLKVATDRAGTVYVFSASSLSNSLRIWRVDGNGDMEVIAGRVNNCGYSLGKSGEAALNACIGGHSRGLEVGPDGVVYFGDGRYQIRKLATPLPGFGVGEFVLPSADGGELYEFDRFGRHLATRDAVTGALRVRFTYDGAGRLAMAVDAYGNTTTIERDGSGLPTAIVAPGGQRTTLALNGEGFLSAIGQPGGQPYQMKYTGGGLISEFIQPGGETSRYSYAADGRLTQAQRPNGEQKTLARVQTNSAVTVTVTSKSGLVTTYLLDSLPSGENRRRVVQPDGTAFTLLVQPDSTRVQLLADGTRITSTVAADPRWGMTAPYIAQEIVTTPGGLVRETTTTKSVTDLSRVNPMSFALLSTDTSEQEGGWSSSRSSVTYESATRTYTNISAEGKESVVTVDDKGQIVRWQMGDAGSVEPILYSYDSRGRLAQVAQGNLSLTNSYNDQNWLVAQSDGTGRTTLYENDAAGRVTRAQLPGGQSYRYAYDANGRLVSVTMPNGSVHSFGYNPVGDEASRSIGGQPGSLTRSFNSDGALSGETLAGGGARSFGFDPFGRLATSTTGYDSGQMSYDNQTGQTVGMSRTPAGGPTHSLQTVYDGSLPVRVDVTGLAPASFVYTYTRGFRLQNQRWTIGNSTLELPLAWNKDNLPVKNGPFQWERYAAQGAVSAIRDEHLRLDFQYDNLRRLASRSAQVEDANLGTFTYSYDASGWLASVMEAGGLEFNTVAYSYDANGQLVQVSRNGEVLEQYTYDANGNRLSRSRAGQPAVTAAYDAQDRLTQLGGVAYSFNADGFLTQRGGDSFSYGVRGELLQAVVGGQTIRYSYDALNRRVAAAGPAGTRHFFYSDLSNPYRLTGVQDEAGVVTWLFYDEAGLLVSLERQGSRFYVLTDQVGTPRTVTDATGAVVKQLVHDSYGLLLSDSAPAFDLPIGFSGGLADKYTGLLYFNWRDYDPAAGRWTARDPLAFEGSSRNLYAYAGNDPVGHRDPLGLAELGFSAYAGVGGGASIVWEPSDPKTMAVCAEGGVGVGGGVEFDLMQGLPRDRDGKPTNNTRLIAEVGTSVGPIKLGLAGELDLDCFNGTVKANVGAGAFKVETDTGGGWTGKVAGFTPASIEKMSGGKMEGKVAIKQCWSFGLPF
ncbi:MAG: RHS repeat-associated core domain-containing protein, partial [Caldilineaceae bacterium]